MKSIQLMLALCTLATATKAQFTGQSFYGHNGTAAILSSGTYVNGTPGFIMAGYQPNTAAGACNFLVDKVDPDGTFASGSGFSNEYYLFDAGVSCNNTCMQQENNCYGISVIENSAACSTIPYALTASFDAGVLFATLDNAGKIVSSALYTLPGNGKISSKPLITMASTGDYYLCGYFNDAGIDKMYALKVNASGAAYWSVAYDLSTPPVNQLFQPRAIIEDFYPGFAELAIAGTLGSTTSDGFLVTLDGSTGLQLIGSALASGQVINESISSIALAASNGGYLLGGSTDMTPGPERAWMCRINANGTFTGTFWTSRIEPSTNTGMGEVIAVAERFSATYNSYEYYGLTLSTGAAGGMLVLKLDSIGLPFSQPGNTNNEFLYNDAAGTIALPAAMSHLDAGPAGNNTGIHVFGTDQSNPGRFFLNQAFYNGATGSCASPSQQNLTVLKNRLPGPQIDYPFTMSASSPLIRCKNHYILDPSINYIPNQPCSVSGNPAGPYAGNNNRSAAPSGPDAQGNAGGVSIYPNPVSQAAEISYTANEGGEVKISLCDVLGKHITTLDSGYKKGENRLQLDMNSLHLQTGVYFINVTMNGTTTQQKIIYTKN